MDTCLRKYGNSTKCLYAMYVFSISFVLTPLSDITDHVISC